MRTIVIAEYERPEEVAKLFSSDNRVLIVNTADAALHICSTCRVDLVITREVFREGMKAADLASGWLRWHMVQRFVW